MVNNNNNTIINIHNNNENYETTFTEKFNPKIIKILNLILLVCSIIFNILGFNVSGAFGGMRISIIYLIIYIGYNIYIKYRFYYF